MHCVQSDKHQLTHSSWWKYRMFTRHRDRRAATEATENDSQIHSPHGTAGSTALRQQECRPWSPSAKPTLAVILKLSCCFGFAYPFSFPNNASNIAWVSLWWPFLNGLSRVRALIPGATCTHVCSAARGGSVGGGRYTTRRQSSVGETWSYNAKLNYCCVVYIFPVLFVRR